LTEKSNNPPSMRISGIFFRPLKKGFVMSDYKADWLKAVESGEPWLVMVSEDWCGPCQQIKNYLKQLKAQGVNVHYTVLSTSSPYAEQLMKGNSAIPNWYIWQWNPDTESFKKLHNQVGSQNHKAIIDRYFVKVTK